MKAMRGNLSVEERMANRSWLRRFFSSMWRAIRSYFVLVGILSTVAAVLLTVIVVHAISVESTRPGKTPKAIAEGKSLILHLKLDGAILERTPGFEEEFLTTFFGKSPGIYLPDLRQSLRQAAENIRVVGAFLEIGSIKGSLADLSELRDIISEFRDGGKEVYSWFAVGSNQSLYLASAGSQISMAPVGDMTLPGPVFTMAYFGDALRKLGVSIEVIRSGKYKSAFEPLIANEPTAETQEMYSAMEASLRDHFIEVVGKGRLGDGDEVRDKVSGWFRRSSFTMEQAVQEGIVDALAYRDDAISVMENKLVAGKIEFNDFDDYYSDFIDFPQHNDSPAALGLIEAIGEIHLDGSEDEDAVTPERIYKRVQWALEDDTIKAVVLRVSSPGGSAIASDLIWADIARLAAKKPVVVSMGAYAASGGYYISAPATKIIAEPTTITGSIGVIGMVAKFSEFREKYGLSFHVVSGTDRISYYHPGKVLSDGDRAVIDEQIADTYQTFVRKVAAGRKRTEKEIDDIAQGRVWTGKQALAIGLVDDLGGLKEAYKSAKQLAGLDVDTLYPVKHYRGKKMSILECLRSPHDVADCFEQGGIAIKAELVNGKTSPHEKLVLAAERFVSSLKTSPIQAIWPGYINVDLDAQ